MKNTAYLLVFIGLIFAACENSDEVGIPEYVLSSDAQYIHGSSGIDTITSYYAYEQGKLVLIENYTNNATIPSTHEFFYDSNARLLRSHVVNYGRFDTKFEEDFYSYVYNDQGKIASQILDSIIQHYGGPITAIIPEQEDYLYDNQLRLISIHWHSEYEGRLRKFFYDDQSNLIKEEYYRDADDTDPTGIAEFTNFDNHLNPFYTFMQKVNIPYHESGYSYSAHNVLEAKQALGGTTTTYKYEYGNDHDFPTKIYANGKLKHELTYEKLN